MKRIFFCLIGVAAFCLHSIAGAAQQAVQPFSAVFWTTTTLHSSSGKALIFTRRTVYTRDSSGNTRSERYRPTKGLQQDESAPLEDVQTRSTSTQDLSLTAHPSNETVQVSDLGTSLFAGLTTSGRRQVFKGAGGQITGTLETWFCPNLGLTVHMTSSNAKGDTVTGDLSNLQLNHQASPVAAPAPPAIPLIILYRHLFTLIDHMERDRQANDPNRHVNMIEIEDHLRKKLNLSGDEWQTLVAKSVKVESYSHEKSEEAHRFVRQDQASRSSNPLGKTEFANRFATLHRMQLDLNTHVQGEIDGLKEAVGPVATEHIQAYLQGSLAASIHTIPSNTSRLKAARAGKEQVR